MKNIKEVLLDFLDSEAVAIAIGVYLAYMSIRLAFNIWEYFAG